MRILAGVGSRSRSRENFISVGVRVVALKILGVGVEYLLIPTLSLGCVITYQRYHAYVRLLSAIRTV